MVGIVYHNMNILKVNKRLLAYVGIGVDQYVNINGIQVPRLIMRALLSCLIIMSCLQLIISVKVYRRGTMEEFLFPAHCIFFCLIKCSIYWALMYKTNDIAQLMGFIELVVKRRKYFFAFLCKKHWQKRRLTQQMWPFF